MADDKRAPTEPPEASSPLRAIVGLALIAVLIVGVLYVIQQLRQASAIQDCVASGRSNCAPITSGH